MGRTQPPLKRMFGRVPGRYDLVNRLVTLGLDQRWRRLAVEACLERTPRRILDICSGTGDLAVAIAERAPDGAAVVAADFSEPMLELAADKAGAAGVSSRVDLALLDAAALPFADGSFDVVAVAFGFRNLTYKNEHRDLHLEEIARVVAPGGRFVIVESSQPGSAALRAGFHLYLRAWVGPLGGLISGQRGAYRYLARSAEGFYHPNEVEQLLLDAGFAAARTRPLLAGAAALHIASR
jgi:demethylmenaquinone methyltransferase/2-methoxy-6-polyprenyl-1,4-benzoquinol methylase